MADAVQGAQSFSRSINVLQLIADADRPLSRAEVLDLCGLTRPTLYRIIASLEAEGLIEAAGGNRYRLGARLVSLSRRALAQNDVRKLAEPWLTELRDATGETVHLAIRSGDEMVYIDKVESLEAVRMASTIGTRVAFHSTSVGKAYLSAMAAEDAATLIDRLDLIATTPATITDAGALRISTVKARSAGFVREIEENEPGITCFGAAIMEARDRPVGCISVSVPLFRLKEPEHYSAPLLRAVDEISGQLGYVEQAR
jgi:DNA-binding IclR family transcriptional regulator